mmetsp:Transcript_39322/g.94167  ORF Transcript_39322/g.94167 Transcript_39322/m.94167 type:complete len:126 (-) Transcript_39322:37-414(-)
MFARYFFANEESVSSFGFRLDFGCGDESTMADILALSFLWRCGRCHPWLHHPAPITTTLAVRDADGDADGDPSIVDLVELIEREQDKRRNPFLGLAPLKKILCDRGISAHGVGGAGGARRARSIA